MTEGLILDGGLIFNDWPSEELHRGTYDDYRNHHAVYQKTADDYVQPESIAFNLRQEIVTTGTFSFKLKCNCPTFQMTDFCVHVNNINTGEGSPGFAPADGTSFLSIPCLRQSHQPLFSILVRNTLDMTFISIPILNQHADIAFPRNITFPRNKVKPINLLYCGFIIGDYVTAYGVYDIVRQGVIEFLHNNPDLAFPCRKSFTKHSDFNNLSFKEKLFAVQNGVCIDCFKVIPEDSSND